MTSSLPNCIFPAICNTFLTVYIFLLQMFYGLPFQPTYVLGHPTLMSAYATTNRPRE